MSISHFKETVNSMMDRTKDDDDSQNGKRHTIIHKISLYSSENQFTVKFLF